MEALNKKTALESVDSILADPKLSSELETIAGLYIVGRLQLDRVEEVLMDLLGPNAGLVSWEALAGFSIDIQVLPAKVVVERINPSKREAGLQIIERFEFPRPDVETIVTYRLKSQLTAAAAKGGRKSRGGGRPRKQKEVSHGK